METKKLSLISLLENCKFLSSKNGECVYESPSIEEIKAYCQKEVETLWDEVKRFENPHRYYVDLSQKLWDIKKELCVKNAIESNNK